MVDGNIHHLAREINQLVVPAHLTAVDQLVVELDGDRVFGVLLNQLARSGQSFNLGTLTSQHPLVATDDRRMASSICFVLDGPGYVDEQIGEAMWTFDDLVRYRITDTNEDGTYILALADDAFADYAKYEGFTEGRVRVQKEEPAVEGYKLTRAHLPELICILGQIVTHTTACLVEYEGKIDYRDFTSIVQDAIGCTDDEREELLQTYMAAAAVPEQQAFAETLERILVTNIEAK